MRQVVHNRSIGKGFGMVMDSRGLATDDKDQMVITNDKRHHGANQIQHVEHEKRPGARVMAKWITSVQPDDFQQSDII